MRSRMAVPNGERERFFIITAGRTGSTLLASILADAGADLGMPPTQEWDVSSGGDMELAEIRHAANNFRLAFERSPKKPAGTLSKWIWTHHISNGKRWTRRALTRARFLKAVNLDLAVPYAIKLGYFPRIIVSYRSFTDHAISCSQTLGSRSLSALAEDYARTYGNALFQIQTFGGCAIDYAELTDPNRVEWASALAEVTGLSADALLASRARRVNSLASSGRAPTALSESAERIYVHLEQYAGRAVPPSAQALRNWAHTMKDAPARPERAVSRRLGVRGVAAGAAALCKAFVDRRVPWYARIVALACLLSYFVAPWDPVPNRLAYIGHLDDAIAAVLSILTFIRLVPAGILRQLRLEAATRLGTSA